MQAPSLNAWLAEAKAAEHADLCGMYLFHNGVVRKTAKAAVRQGEAAPFIAGMHFSFDRAKLDAAVRDARCMTGIYYVRVWLNEGDLAVGDDLMLVLIGGDIRPNVLSALTALVARIKTDCVKEDEVFA